jgi:rhodanese-related sulfurtransferase
VARQLQDLGFKVFVIAGGLRAWRKAGHPMERVPLEDLIKLPTFS